MFNHQLPVTNNKLRCSSWLPKLKSLPTIVTPKNRPARTCKRFLRFALSLCSFVPEPVRRSFCEGGCLCGYESIMQNKPNLLNTQMNVSSVLIEDYENERLCKREKNKPNQTQSCPPPADLSAFYPPAVGRRIQM